ncbi:MAG: TRAP transporter substrate-binding protein [Acidobacteria bacterium]|nr:TRAP transporter substrate-binding protein [Acidobacteriota bacterium]
MDDHGSAEQRHGGRALSFFLAGLVLGVLLATVGFGIFVRWQKTTERNALMAAGAAPAPGTAGQRQIVLKLGHALDTGHPVHIAMEHMAQRLEELSGGTVALDIYPSAVLGSEVQLLEQVQNGSLDMTKVSAAIMENFVPEMAVFGLPYLFRDGEHYWQVLDGPIGRELLQKGEPKLLHGLCYYDSGSRNFYTRSKPILTPDDLKGLKIRVMNSPTAIAMVKAMGAAPTPIAWGELYSALAQGTVDGAENNPPSFTSNKHYEACKYFTLDGHTRIPDILLIGTKTWDRLSPQIRGWVQQAADESSVFERELWAQETTRSLEVAEQEGVTVYEVDQAPFVAKVAPMLDQIEDPRVRALAQQIREVR